VLIYELDNPNTPADEAHGFAPHYELHIWTELPNPAGPFMEWNANATCRYHRPDAQADAKKPLCRASWPPPRDHSVKPHRRLYCGDGV
jgi:hypothetical protein